MKLKTFLKHLRPRYIFANRRGRCAVCDRPTLFLLTDSAETIRNHAVCIRCGSSSRHRHLALWIKMEYQASGIGKISEFKNRPDLTVFNASTKGSIAKALGTAPNIICSEYFDDVESGGFKNGVLNQDLQQLTFKNDSIDLVITEDVFEHVPNVRRCFAELHRVLKKGGKHIFTIPYYFDRKTRDLFKIENGNRVLFEPIEYHGDPIRGLIPCFTHFGHDLLGILDEMGFEMKIEWSWYADQARFGTFDCYTFIARKR